MTSVRFFLFSLLAIFSPSTFADVVSDGAVVVHSGSRSCSGSLFRLPTMSNSSQVHVLTAGHCAFAPRVAIALMSRGLTEIGNIENVELLHSQIDALDVAIYKLPMTYAQLESRFGIRPLTLSERAPDTHRDLTLVSAVWVEQQACRVEGVSALREGRYNWSSALRMNSACDVVPGYSGSSLVSDQNEIVGIIHTLNERGEQCTMGNPCEISGSRTEVLRKRAYGMQTFGLTRCFNENGDFDLYQSQCPLTH